MFTSNFMAPALKAGRGFYRRLGLSTTSDYSLTPRKQRIGAAAVNAQIGRLLREGVPAMFSRLGVSEANVLLNHLEICDLRRTGGGTRLHKMLKGFRGDWDQRATSLLVNNAGFFYRNPADLERFAEQFTDDLGAADWLGIWGFVPGEALLSDLFCPEAKHFEPGAMEPYYSEEPWSAALRGKRVLVIHPFASTIRSQYEKRRRLFTNPAVLPDFELFTVPAVQSSAGSAVPFPSWFDALDWMKEQIDNLRFDVALIGAGAYGLPLAAHVKRQGSTAIQVGGALQIMFGIKGRRWDAIPQVKCLYNEHWTRPSATETPREAALVEGACYW
jgi:hypothetical protein